MVDLTADAQEKLTNFSLTELPTLLGPMGVIANLMPMKNLQERLTTGNGIDPAVRDRLITAVNANPDAAIAAMRKKVQEDPNIIQAADANPNQVLPQLLGALNGANPAVTANAEISPAGTINPPGSDQPQTKAATTATAQPVTVPATPEQKADYYLKNEIDPALAARREQLPEADRAAFDARTQAWRTQVRDAIVGYEKTEVTPEKAMEILRQNGRTPADLEIFGKKAAEAKAQGLTPMQQAVEGFKAMDMARNQMPQYDKKHPGKPLFLGNEANVEAMFRSRIYQSEQGGLTAEQLRGLGRNASMVDFLTGSGGGAPDGVRVPNYNLMRPDIDEKTRQPVAADPNKAAENAPVTTPAATSTATATASSMLDNVGAFVGSMFVTPAHAEERPATTTARDATVQPPADQTAAATSTATATVDPNAYRTQLMGEIVTMGMQMAAKPGVKKVLDAAQQDQDMALAVQNLTGIDVHQKPEDAMRDLQIMTTAQLEEKKASLARISGMLEMADPMLESMSPQAVNSLTTLVNGGTKLMNMDGNNMMGDLSSLFSGKNFDLNNLMGGLQGMGGGLGGLLKTMWAALSSFMGEMFGKLTGSDSVMSASNSGGQLTSDVAEVAKLKPANVVVYDSKKAVDDSDFTKPVSQRGIPAVKNDPAASAPA